MSENEITELPNQNHVTIGAVIDDLLSGQIDGDYQNLSRAISGPLTDEIQSIFPDSYQALYLLTSVGRRQVWHAVIAVMLATV